MAHLSSNQVGTMATSWTNNTTKISLTAYFLAATQFRIFSCTCTHCYLTIWQNATAQEKLTGLEKITKIMSLCYLAFQFVDSWKIKIRGALYVHHYLGPQSNCIFPKNSEPFIIFTFPNKILLEETSVQYVYYKVWKI